MIPLAVQLAAIFVLGLCLGSLVNWAIYSFAWSPRPISPWSPVPPELPSRTWFDYVPAFGWLRLRRETPQHGRGFWIRPLLLELSMGGAVAWLFWWEIARFGLVEGQVAAPVVPPSLWPLYLQFASHVVLLCLMTAASFIHIDEKIVPDEITVIGALIGLVLATALPMSLLPHVAERTAPPAIGVPLKSPAGGPAWGPHGGAYWLEPSTAAAPSAWPPNWARAGRWPSLVVSLGCYWLWCFALVPRIWRGRRGVWAAVSLIVRRVGREFSRPPMRSLLLIGSAAIIPFWAFGGAPWAGLLTALVGMVGSGGIVWAIRLIGSLSLRREAMGFGDVTLMMMVGTFLGWQACLIAFFLAPFAALFVGILQLVFRRDDVIPFVPYLCIGSSAVVVAWAPIWKWAQPLLALPALVFAVLAVCLVLLGIVLYLWRLVKTLIFGLETH
jgi:leader peptidase (prepilin peptidase)/N-methyltransferase